MQSISAFLIHLSIPLIIEATDEHHSYVRRRLQHEDLGGEELLAILIITIGAIFAWGLCACANEVRIDEFYKKAWNQTEATRKMASQGRSINGNKRKSKNTKENEKKKLQNKNRMMVNDPEKILDEKWETISLSTRASESDEEESLHHHPHHHHHHHHHTHHKHKHHQHGASSREHDGKRQSAHHSNKRISEEQHHQKKHGHPSKTKKDSHDGR